MCECRETTPKEKKKNTVLLRRRIIKLMTPKSFFFAKIKVSKATGGEADGTSTLSIGNIVNSRVVRVVCSIKEI